MEYLICLFLGALGVVGHSLIKFGSLQKDATAANLEFYFSDYLKKDWPGITLSFVAVLAWVFMYGEAAVKYPFIENYIRCSFFVVGGAGSYLIQTLFSGSKKLIRNTIDEKTNIADNK